MLYCPVGYRPSGKDADKLIYLCHSIIMQRVFDPRYRAGHNDGFVPLKGEYMRNILGKRHWPRIRQAAISSGLVSCSGSYSAGRYSKGYRLREPYAGQKWARRSIRDDRLAVRIQEWRASGRRRIWQDIRDGNRLVAPGVCEHLYRHLQRIRIDATIPEPLTNESEVAVEIIRRGGWRLDVDDYGRIHTNITNLKRSLRDHLAVDGSRLVNCDIANAQPLFIGATLREQRQEESISRGRRRGAGEGQAGAYHMWPAFETLGKPGGKLGNAPDDLQHYLNLCEQGRLYRFIESHLPAALDYGVLKRRVLATLYDKDCHRNAVYSVLDEQFPTLMQRTRDIKREDYRRLAHLAQRTESRFIFGQVVARLASEHPDLFCTTIHDSVMTTAGDEPIILDVMQDEFKQLNINPMIRVEP